LRQLVSLKFPYLQSVQVEAVAQDLAVVAIVALAEVVVV
jgi:hypothetical protein